MKKFFFVIILITSILSFTSCKYFAEGRNEIEDITFIKVIGIKELEEEDINLTVTSRYTPDVKSDEEIARTITVNGETLFDAIRNLNMYSSKKPFWGHLEFILFDEETARKGLVKYLDFFSRQYKFRLDTTVFIVLGATTEEVINSTSLKGHFISDRLTHLVKNIDGISVSHKIQLHELMEMFDRPHTSAYIPCIYLTQVMDGTEEDKKDIALNGFAIFKENQMIGYIKDDLAKGLNWVRNDFASGVITVKDQEGKKISLEVSKAESKIVPVINKRGHLSVNIQITVVSSIGEMYSDSDIFNNKGFDLLEKQQQAIVASQVKGIVAYAQKNRADFLNIWSKVYHKYPEKSKEYYEDWPETFSDIPISIEVESKIVRSYLKRQPMGSEEVIK